MAVERGRSDGRGPERGRGRDDAARRVAKAPRPAQGLLQLQSAAGNRAVSRAVQRTAGAAAPAGTAAGGQEARSLGPGTVAAMNADVAFIVEKLKEQVLFASEEQQILDRLQRWADADAEGQAHGFPGSPHLDKLLLLLTTKVFTRHTARSGFILGEATVNAYDTLWQELEDDRLTAFRALVAKSEKQKTAGPESGPSENLWSTMGEQESIGMMGAAKGLSTGLAGMMDAGAWAITAGVNGVLDKAGVGKQSQMAEPTKIADEVGKGFDQMGDMLFGKDKFSQGEALAGGMNAAEIGNVGGGIIWSLALLGAGGAAEGTQAAQAMTGLDWAAKFKSFDEACGSMADYLLSMQAQGKLTTADLTADARFWMESTKLAGIVVGAIAGGFTSKEGASKAITDVLKKVGGGIKAATASVKIARLVELYYDIETAPGAKEKEAGKLVGDLIGSAFDYAGDKAAEKDKKRAEDAKTAAFLDSLPNQVELEPGPKGEKLELDNERTQTSNPDDPTMHFHEIDLPAGPEGETLELDDERRSPAAGPVPETHGGGGGTAGDGEGETARGRQTEVLEEFADTQQKWGSAQDETAGFEQEPADGDLNEPGRIPEIEPGTDQTWAPEGRLRVPAANAGEWEAGATPGDGRWTPHDPGRYGLEKGESIPFREGVPDLSEYARELPTGEPGVIHASGLVGDASRDFEVADAQAGAQCGKTGAQFEAWRTRERLTWHHYGGGELQLVPQRLHGALAHQGSASEIRAGAGVH